MNGVAWRAVLSSVKETKQEKTRYERQGIKMTNICGGSSKEREASGGLGGFNVVGRKS